MSAIQRWARTLQGAMVAVERGGWVRFEDHEAALNEAVQEAVNVAVMHERHAAHYARRSTARTHRFSRGPRRYAQIRDSDSGVILLQTDEDIRPFDFLEFWLEPRAEEEQRRQVEEVTRGVENGVADGFALVRYCLPRRWSDEP